MTMEQNWDEPPRPLYPELASATKQPGAGGTIAGVILMILGPVIGGIIIAVTAFSSVADVTNAETFISDSVPASIELTAGVETGLWLGDNGYGFCPVYDPEWAPVPQTSVTFGTQRVNDFDLAATFTPEVDGIYTVTCTSAASPFHFRVAPLIQVSGQALGVIVGVVVIALLFFTGLILLIVAIVRRSSWRKANIRPPARAAPSDSSSPHSEPWHLYSDQQPRSETPPRGLR